VNDLQSLFTKLTAPLCERAVSFVSGAVSWLFRFIRFIPFLILKSSRCLGTHHAVGGCCVVAALTMLWVDVVLWRRRMLLRYLYKLTPRDADDETVRANMVLGKLDVVWRTNFGEHGRLQTSQPVTFILSTSTNHPFHQHKPPFPPAQTTLSTSANHFDHCRGVVRDGCRRKTVSNTRPLTAQVAHDHKNTHEHCAKPQNTHEHCAKPQNAPPSPRYNKTSEK
jgi:hypothetical protein